MKYEQTSVSSCDTGWMSLLYWWHNCTWT